MIIHSQAHPSSKIHLFYFQNAANSEDHFIILFKVHCCKLNLCQLQSCLVLLFKDFGYYLENIGLRFWIHFHLAFLFHPFLTDINLILWFSIKEHFELIMLMLPFTTPVTVCSKNSYLISNCKKLNFTNSMNKKRYFLQIRSHRQNHQNLLQKLYFVRFNNWKDLQLSNSGTLVHHNLLRLLQDLKHHQIS